MPVIEDRYFAFQEMVSMIFDTVTTTDLFEAKYTLLDNTKRITFRFSRTDGSIGITFGNYKFQYALNTKTFDRDQFINYLTYIFAHIEGLMERKWDEKDE